MKFTSNTLVNGVLVLAVVGFVATAGYEIRSGRETRAVPQAFKPKLLSDSSLAFAFRKGVREDNRVEVVEFADFQCPACAQLFSELKEIERDLPNKMTVTFRHFPLVRIHPYALEAALASECARDQGSFDAFKDFAYTHQESIGLQPWPEFGRRAGIRDTATFAVCVSSKKHLHEVVTDTLDATRLKLPGTPSLIINKLLFVGVPPRDEIIRQIQQF